MAAFIEEGAEEAQTSEVVVDPAELTSEVQAQSQEQTEEELPEKYRGKSAKDIAKMHMEAERLIGRQGSEVGELRKLVDDYIHTQATTKQQLRTESTEEIDFFADPRKAVENAIENHPKIREAEALTLEMQRAKALNALQTAHPDYQQVVNDSGFQQWVMSSKVRQELFLRADQRYDYDAATELLSSYKERRGTAEQTVAAEKEVRSRTIKAATTTVASGSDETPSKKIYRRSDIMKLMSTDPDRYDSMQDEIMAAYREKRVR